MNSTFRRRDRHHRAFTFIELLVILSVVGIGIYFASTGSSGQGSYYGLRGDVERIVAALQRACIQSASRGEVLLPADVPVTAGVSFYNQQMSTRFQVVDGPSFVNWFDDLAINPEKHIAPPATLAAADARIQTLSKSLRAETILTQVYTSGSTTTPLTDGATFTYRAGRLDIFLVTGAIDATKTTPLNNNFTVVNSPIGAAAPTAWTFDVVNLNAGWVRVRVLSGGFVDISGINPLNTSTAQSQVGGSF